MKALILATVGACIAVSSGFASAAAPAPLGMTIGSTSCAEVQTRINGVAGEAGAKLTKVTAKDPGSLYPGARGVVAYCRGGKLDAVAFTIDKGGMGNPGAQEVYRTLARKYKKVGGGPIPSLGDGFANFHSDGVSIQLSSAHLSFTFNVLYMSKQLAEDVQQELEAQKRAAAQAKNDAL